MEVINDNKGGFGGVVARDTQLELTEVRSDQKGDQEVRSVQEGCWTILA